MNLVFEGENYTNLTSTATIKTAAAADTLRLLGIFVASVGASPTIKVEDGAGTTVVNTFTPLAGVFYPMPCRLTTGLKVTINNVDLTAFWAT